MNADSIKNVVVVGANGGLPVYWWLLVAPGYLEVVTAEVKHAAGGRERISADDIIEPPWKAYNIMKKMNYPYEAITLSKYKLVLNVASLESDLEEMESTAIKALKYYNNTRHIIVYYEDLIKKPYHIIDSMKDPSIAAFWLITMPQIIGGFEYDDEENMRYDQLQDAVAKRKPGWVYLQELSWKKYTQPEIMSPPDTLSKAKGLTVSQFLAADIDNNGYVT
ncbi:hypothetical protein Tco_0363017 [Tanacetum coccineum]